MRGRPITKTRITRLEPWLYLAPSLIFLVTFTHWPIVRSFWLSFFKWNTANPVPRFAGLENYSRMFTDPIFWQVVKNTIWYSLGTVIPSILLALALAVLLNQQLQAQTLFRTTLFYPTLIPTAAAAMIWMVIFTPGYGLLNYYLVQLGGRSIEWLNDADYAMWSLIIVGIWKHAGYYMLVFLAGLQAIPPELYEAAITEGASWWQRFRHVTLPMLSPTSFFIGIIAVIDSFQSVDQVYIMTKGGPYNSTNVLIYYIYENAFKYADMGYGATISVFLFVILLFFTVAYNQALAKRVTYE